MIEAVPNWVYIGIFASTVYAGLAFSGVDVLGYIRSLSPQPPSPAPERVVVSRSEPNYIELSGQDQIELDSYVPIKKDEQGHKYLILYDPAGLEIVRCWDYQLEPKYKIDALSNKSTVWVFDQDSEKSRLKFKNRYLTQHLFALTQQTANLHKDKTEVIKREFENVAAIKKVIYPAPVSGFGGMSSSYYGRYGGKGGLPPMVGGEGGESEFEG